MLSDPIVALATPPGRSALAVIRVSGNGAFAVASKVIRGFSPEPARRATLAGFEGVDGQLIDRGIYIAYPGPHSYTGEDLVELSCHGGLQVPSRLLGALHVAGARPAAPGEFTRRAVLNGKLDLLRAEAVGDLIDATAPVQAAAALSQLEGGLSDRLGRLRQSLLELQALLSYEIDFPEEDEGPVPVSRIAAEIEAVSSQIAHLLASAPSAERFSREDPTRASRRCSTPCWAPSELWSPTFLGPPGMPSRPTPISWGGRCGWRTLRGFGTLQRRSTAWE
jgi:tRNA modification GTPase